MAEKKTRRTRTPKVDKVEVVQKKPTKPKLTLEALAAQVETLTQLILTSTNPHAVAPATPREVAAKQQSTILDNMTITKNIGVDRNVATRNRRSKVIQKKQPLPEQATFDPDKDTGVQMIALTDNSL